MAADQQSEPAGESNQGGAVPMANRKAPDVLAYGTRLPLHRRPIPPKIVGLVMLGLVLLVAWTVIYIPTGRPRTMSMAVSCASHLRQVGIGCIIYANDNNGHWPDDFSQMMIAEDVPPEILVCPAGSDTPAAGPTTQAIAANFALPGHNSYVYLGKGLVEPLAPNLVMAYERPQPKGHPGINVLFADGHVERLDASVATTFLRTAQASSTAFAWTPAK